MRLANLKTDHWELESGEDRRTEYGETFFLPPLDERRNLYKGELAQLLFQIEGLDENGATEIIVERMWVLVTQVEGDLFLGRLANQPACLEPEDSVYLTLGAEVPFRADHVIAVHHWAEADVQDFLTHAPLKVWHGSLAEAEPTSDKGEGSSAR